MSIKSWSELAKCTLPYLDHPKKKKLYADPSYDEVRAFCYIWSESIQYALPTWPGSRYPSFLLQIKDRALCIYIAWVKMLHPPGQVVSFIPVGPTAHTLRYRIELCVYMAWVNMLHPPGQVVSFIPVGPHTQIHCGVVARYPKGEENKNVN